MNTPRIEFLIGDVRVLPNRNLLISDAGRYSIEPRMMEVLCALAANPQKVVTRDNLITEIWQVSFGGDESLTRAISLLRKTFKKAGETDAVIETIPKRGYRLTRLIGTPEPAATLPNKTPRSSALPGPAPVSTDKKPLAKDPVLKAVKASLVSDQKSQNDISETAPIPARPARKISPAVIALPILIAALGIGWYVGQLSTASRSPIASSTAADRPESNRQPQAQIAMAIIHTYEDGKIGLAEAIESAARHVVLAESQSPLDPDTQIARGWLEFYKNNHNTAMVTFERVIADDPFKEIAWLGKGMVSKAQGNIELSLFSVEQALKLNAFSTPARRLRTEILLQTGQLDDAQSEVESILNFDSENAFALATQAKLQLFDIYDKNQNQRLEQIEISDESGDLFGALDLDNSGELSIEEFQIKGVVPIGNKSGKSHIRFDLGQPNSPIIDNWNKNAANQ